MITALTGIVIPHEINWYEWTCSTKDDTGAAPACPCTYTQQPILLLRGLCPHSALKPLGNVQYTPKQLAAFPSDLFLLGRVSTQIRYNDSSKQWILTDAVASVRAESNATKMSYVLGKHQWNVTNDVFKCYEGKPYTVYLKLSGCSKGDFTCNDGQCVTMEQRCNQVPDCRDESDEENCRILMLKMNYNMKVPPIVPTWGGDFNKTQVEISIMLLKIVSMNEVQNTINFQFGISLQWKENRATYYNLKDETSLNALTDAEISTLWLPYVVYANTDMKEAVELKFGGNNWRTILTIIREGNFTSSNVEVLDEIEIFAGAENRLTLSQTYTKSFQCIYNLKSYPFDTQASCSYVY